MTVLGRRAFMAASAASIAAPTTLGAKECPMAGMDWITMSLEERNLAYNNVEQKLSPMRLPIVNKPLGIVYGTRELPAMIASSRDYHAYRSQGHAPGDLTPIANANHFTMLDELLEPSSTLTRTVMALAEYQNP
jgi:pimeloyl-ACP methyl ester carboxylesterase